MYKESVLDHLMTLAAMRRTCCLGVPLNIWRNLDPVPVAPLPRAGDGQWTGGAASMMPQLGNRNKFLDSIFFGHTLLLLAFTCLQSSLAGRGEEELAAGFLLRPRPASGFSMGSVGPRPRLSTVQNVFQEAHYCITPHQCTNSGDPCSSRNA